MKRHVTASVLGLLALAGCDRVEVNTRVSSAPRVVAASDIEAGRYLVQIGGCNDCHTPGYIQSGGRTPESDWLKGSRVGHHGPWGTTYAHNLRLTAANLTEDAWVQMLATRKARPIMPWPSVNTMAEADQRALYRYIRSLEGDPGQPAPEALPPGQTPTGPHQDHGLKDVPAPPSPG